MMESKIFDAFLIFVICCSFVYGSPVGNSSDSEIPNPDALTKPLPSKTPSTQVPEIAPQGNISSNATDIKSGDTAVADEKQSKLPVDTVSAKNVTVDVKPVGNNTTVPVTTMPPETTVNETTSNPKTTTNQTVIVYNTTAAATDTTATTPTTPTAPGNAANATSTAPTTQSPEITSASAVSPTSVKSEKMENDREFDGPSFIGGIVLAFGLTGIGEQLDFKVKTKKKKRKKKIVMARVVSTQAEDIKSLC